MVVTGGTSGIGLATATVFAREGAFVFITGRRREVLDAAARAIGDQVTAVCANFAIEDQLDVMGPVLRSFLDRKLTDEPPTPLSRRGATHVRVGPL